MATNSNIDDDENKQQVDVTSQETNGTSFTNNNSVPTNSKTSKKKRRRKKKKIIYSTSSSYSSTANKNSSLSSDVEVEYVAPSVVIDHKDPHFSLFSKIFDKFALIEEAPEEDKQNQQENSANNELEEPDESIAEEAKPLTRKERKKAAKIDVSELKRIATKPDVVEIHDATAQDPQTLVYLKAYKNTVPVPRHWSQKRKYLQGKRGIEKAPFKLPEFIQDTGIQQIRDAYAAKEAEKSTKQKARQRMQPKLGLIDIDYQVLQDAFFKYQTKPKMTSFGDLYFEGKEFQVKSGAADFKPGVLSDKLKHALGMPSGAPPPWLINMQKYGPPPSFPKLRIPGLNAPIPDGASYGYHPGGWGRLPVDAFNKPIYNDYFIADANADAQKERENDAYRAAHVKHWGEPEIIEEEEEYEEETVLPPPSIPEVKRVLPPEPPKPQVKSELPQPVSVVDVPEAINIRKNDIVPPPPPPATDVSRPLYQVLEQQPTSIGSSLVGSTYKYVIPPAEPVNTPSTVELDIKPSTTASVVDILQPEPTTSSQTEEESKKRKRKEEKDKKKKKKIKLF